MFISVVGILAGPSVLGWVSAIDQVDLLAKLGITLLLFVVGLKLDLNIFIWRSLRDGADVAWRAFHPMMPIAPNLVDYPLRLPPGMPRVFMINTVSLLPGTLSAELGANCLKLHVLYTRKSVLSELMTVERVVARMFGISLQNAKGDECNEEI